MLQHELEENFRITGVAVVSGDNLCPDDWVWNSLSKPGAEELLVPFLWREGMESEASITEEIGMFGRFWLDENIEMIV
jgi:hypothetical protein